MKPLPLALMIAALAGTAAGGYWFGRQHGAAPREVAAGTAPATAKPAKKLLYYRNPMGLADTSPVPKKDSMGMDYIAVYEGEDAADNDSGIRISSEKIQKLGVRSEAATLQALPATLRTSARIEIDERGQHVIAPRFEGWVERLQVNTTGQAVAAGQPLFEVYSPDLATAEQEYTLVAGNPNLKGLAEASLTRLRNWGVAESEIKALAAGGTARARPTVTFRAPVSGVVVEKKAVAGMRFMAGEALFQIADLSKVWVVADVPEQDAARLRLGQAAKVQVDALPGTTLQGRVDFIAPLLKNETRTLSVRVELPNPGHRLRPGMYANLLLESGGSEKLLTVPNSAVLDSGRRQMVLVERGEGRFEPREVSLGQRGDERVAVLSGLKEGERVVVAANFLIDAESNLKAALGGFGGLAEPAVKPTGVGHHASGKIDEIDAKAGSVTISHGPVASLKWPAMTMEFQPANPSLLQGLKPGTAVDFEFVERGKGEWVITKVEAAGNAAAAHSGH